MPACVLLYFPCLFEGFSRVCAVSISENYWFSYLLCSRANPLYFRTMKCSNVFDDGVESVSPEIVGFFITWRIGEGSGRQLWWRRGGSVVKLLHHTVAPRGSRLFMNWLVKAPRRLPKGSTKAPRRLREAWWRLGYELGEWSSQWVPKVKGLIINSSSVVV